jgi:flagellar M-ring protein FliF
MDLAQNFQLLWQNLAGLGPRRLTALGVVGLTLFGAITLGSYFIARSDYQPLYIGLSQTDSGRMAVVLSEVGIPYETSPDATRILVPASAMARARGILAERGLPTSSDAGYELFDKIGPLGLTSFMQEVTKVRALEGEISRTLNGMTGVVSSRVHLVFGERGSLRVTAQTPTASVVLKLGVAPERAPVEAIRNVVAAAVPGLATDNVRVVSADGAVLAVGGESSQPGATKMFELERAFSTQLKTNLIQTLAPVLGLSNFQSSISVRLNADQSTVNENIFDPESRVERSIRVVKEAGNSKDGSADQAVSVERNVPPSTDGAQTSQNQKSNQRKDEITNYEISSKTVSTTKDGYRVENISVALVVNKANLKNADGTPLDEASIAAKLAEIERLATTAVGLDPARGDKMAVSAQEFQVESMDGSDLGADGLSVILENNSSSVISALVLVLAILAIVWFGIKPLLRVLLEKPAMDAQPVLIGSPDAADGNMEFEMATAPIISEASFAGDMADMQGGSVAPLVARLNELIAKDPEQAVAVFRRWIRTEGS